QRLPWRPTAYTSGIFSSRRPLFSRLLGNIQQMLRHVARDSSADTATALADLTLARDQLLEKSVSRDFGAGGILLLGEIALALYQIGYPEEAQRTLQQTFSHIPETVLRSRLPAPSLGDNLENNDLQFLFSKYEEAGWYAGTAEWMTHPAIGHGPDLNFIALDLPLSEQGEAVLALAQTAVEKGDSQAAIDLIPYVSRSDEQVRVGTMIAAEVMNKRRDRILLEDPDSAILQSDLIGTEIVSIATELPDSLLKVRAYLAVSEGYVMLESMDKAERWLSDAITLMQSL
ncbi:MAG: hypothetical protein AAFU53_01985, partial [Cyanobacteria bacterium J06632_3]